MKRFLLILPAFVVACATDPAPPASGEDEVRTSDCPATINLELEKPSIYSRTPSKYHNGRVFTAGEKEVLETRMKDARRLPKTPYAFTRSGQGGGQCSYSTASGPSAVLRGSAAKPVFDVTSGAFRFYAFPKAYSTAGLTFENGARANVFTQMSAAGHDYAGGLIVKIGQAKISGLPTGPGTPELVDRLMNGFGRNDQENTESSTPIEMVKEYIALKNNGDNGHYHFTADAPKMEVDGWSAGTMSKEVALRDVEAAIRDGVLIDGDEQEANVQATVDKAKETINALAAAGAAFGFDAGEQNNCAAPTWFLLVIDPAGRTVYGVDLTPCDD